MEKVQRIFQKLGIWTCPFVICLFVFTFPNFTPIFRTIMLILTSVYYVAMVSMLIRKLIKRRKDK